MGEYEFLHQHQLNGLRFLYRQFRKKHQGVIVNCPSECGKTLLVAVFLQKILDERLISDCTVLILCNQDEEITRWQQTILQWTQIVDDDIIIESPNANIRNKKIFIKLVTDCSSMSSYVRRKWSIVIFKGDIIGKKMNSALSAIQSDFKIWLTSTDMMKDLLILSSIYSWIYPNTKFDIDKFTPMSTENKKQKLEKIVKLERFLENTLYRNNHVKEFSPIEKLHISPKPRKNKDPTGTKVKRSKRKLCDENPPPNTITTNINENVTTLHNNPKQRKESGLHNMTEKIIKDKDTNTFNPDSINVGDISNANDFCNLNDSQSIMNFNSALEEIIENENYIPQASNEIEKDDEIEIYQPKQDKNIDEIVDNSSIINKYTNTSLFNNTTITTSENKSIRGNLTQEISENGNKTDTIEPKNDMSVNIEVPDKSTSKNTDVSVAESKSVINMFILEDILREHNQMETSNDDLRKTEVHKMLTLNSETEIKSTLLLDEIKDNTIEEKSDIINAELKLDSNIIANSTKDATNTITAKLNELEEKTLKKFKGSLLDSIF